jgi:hypothetical protein
MAESSKPEPRTYWNGLPLPVPARRGTAVVADAPEFPGYWARDLIGKRIEVVEVNLAGVSLAGTVDYLDDRDGSGWRKVTEGRGGPGFGHASLDIERGSFAPTVSPGLQQARFAQVVCEHQPSRWRSITTELEVLSCCGQDFGPVARRPKKDDRTAWEAWADHLAGALAEVESDA